MRYLSFKYPGIFLLSAIIFLASACKKSDHWPKPCFRGPACEAQSLLTSGGLPQSFPYKYKKTFGPDGRVVFLEARTGPVWNRSNFRGPVRYSGKQVYLLYTNKDTVLTALLNDCGQVERAKSHKSAWVGFFPTSEYYYDHRGRLSWVRKDFNPNFPPVIYIYRYDKYDNIIRIYNKQYPKFYTAYTYDYSHPIKGGFYEQGLDIAIGDDLLEILELIHTQPHHLLLKAESYIVPSRPSVFYDQVITKDGYLSSYSVNPLGDTQQGLKAELSWECRPGTGSMK